MDQDTLLEIVGKIVGYAAKQIFKAKKKYEKNQFQIEQQNQNLQKTLNDNEPNETKTQKTIEKIIMQQQQKQNEKSGKVNCDTDSDSEIQIIIQDGEKLQNNNNKSREEEKQTQFQQMKDENYLKKSSFPSLTNYVPMKFSKQYKCRFCQKQYSHRSTRHAHERKMHRQKLKSESP